MQIITQNRRSDIPLRNNYYLNPSNGGDYTVTVYFINEYKCQIIVRRYDNTIGWGFLELVIENFIDGSKELLEIPPSRNSMLVIERYTRTELLPVEYTAQKTPKIIVQTSETNICKDILAYNSYMSIIESNPEYEYVFFNSTQRREFIKDNFDENVLLAYDIIVPGAYKADIFRYCFLYKKGGCYLDFKMIERQPLRNIIKEDDELLICIDYERSNSYDKRIGTSYLNSIIFTIPGNELFMGLINKCVENISLNQKLYFNEIDNGSCTSILDITGPTLFCKVFKDHIEASNLRFKHIIENNDESKYSNFQIVNIDTKNLIFTKTHKTYSYPNHYSFLWNKKELFYKNHRKIGDWAFFVYPHNYNDVFEFNVLDRNTFNISREGGQGWFLELKIVIINNITSNVVTMDIGRCHTGKMSISVKNMFTQNLPSNVFYSDSVIKDDINIDKPIIVAVPSVINVSKNPLAGINTRSIYSENERYEQTVLQLKSIKEKIPGSIVILQEASVLSTEKIIELSKRCNYIILYNDPKAYFYCHQNSTNKGLGELYVLNHICTLVEDQSFECFCKFGGRYKFTDNFSIDNFKNKDPVAYAIKGNGRLGIIAETIFYSIPKKFVKLYHQHINAWLEPTTTEPAEHIFTMFLECVRSVKLVKTLGVEGYGSTSGRYNMI